MKTATLLLTLAAVSIAAPTPTANTPAALEPTPASAIQENGDEADFEKRRLELAKRWGSEGAVKPAKVKAESEELFGKDITEQSKSELEMLAKRANAAANLVGMIQREYASYYRENYRYDFVKEKVAPMHDAWVVLGNELKGIRNQAYYNLGCKSLAAGDELGAFLLFNDAFRLASFTDEAGDHKGMRYKAEMKMKEILGVEGIESYIYWK